MRDETFVIHPDTQAACRKAAQLFNARSIELRAILPASADIRHVGATSIPGCLTKGDLDIVVRVPAGGFHEADHALSLAYSRNIGSVRTDTFCAFEDAAATPHLGIQLVAIGTELDVFHLFAEALLSKPDLVAHYNALKRQHDGGPMQDYRDAKDAFIAAVLAR
jgi:GrpB-like predicted nucleotidyltransferase (UPF0157 family)